MIPTWLKTIHEENKSQVDMQRLHKMFQEGELLGPWACKDGLLFFKGRIYLLPSSPLMVDVIQQFHSATHEGLHKTLQRLRSQFIGRE